MTGSALDHDSAIDHDSALDHDSADSVLPAGRALTADGMLAALDPEQREVVLALEGPVCVLAGAGTGKTRAITHRIAYGAHAGLYTPQQVLAVTFTARAAGEMRTRLRELGVGGVQARTFHAAALRQLGYFFPRVVGGRPPEILEHKARMVAEAAGRLRLTVDRTAVRDLSAEVEWSKVSLLTPQTYPPAARAAGRGEPAGLPPETVARLITVYEETKTDRGVIDFEDVLLLMAGIIEAHPEVATAVRGQYRHFVVDEYQDVSALQQRLLEQWLGGRDALCVVGDPSQTIYSFTGASPKHLLDFPRRYPRCQHRPAGPRLPVHTADRHTGQPVAGPPGQRQRPGPAAADRPAGERSGAEADGSRRRRDRGRRRGQADHPVGRRRHPAPGDRRPVPDQLAVRAVRAGTRRCRAGLRAARR